MIQFPRLRENPHCSPTWLWMTNPIYTPPSAFSSQRSPKLKIWLSSPALLSLNFRVFFLYFLFCFLMTLSQKLPPHPINPRCLHSLPIPLFTVILWDCWQSPDFQTVLNMDTECQMYSFLSKRVEEMCNPKHLEQCQTYPGSDSQRSPYFMYIPAKTTGPLDINN